MSDTFNSGITLPEIPDLASFPAARRPPPGFQTIIGSKSNIFAIDSNGGFKQLTNNNIAGFMTYYVPSSEEYNITKNSQALIAMTVKIDGIVINDGIIIELR